jgi:hypothetical protein
MQTGKVFVGVVSVLLTAAVLLPPLYAASNVSPEGVIGDVVLPEASQQDDASSYAATGLDPNQNAASESTSQTEEMETTPQAETSSGTVDRSGVLVGHTAATEGDPSTEPTPAATGLSR